MVKHEGVKSLYKGLDAGIMRQIIYAGTRLGVYNMLYEKKLKKIHDEGKGEIGMFDRFSIALVGAIAGSLVGNPIDLSMVRLQSENFLQVEINCN